MFELRKTQTFITWFHALRDQKARNLISNRLLMLEQGHWGDIDNVGEGVVELRIHVGPGYRVYVVRRGKAVIVVLGGGDKRTQKADIKQAKKTARNLE